MREQVADVGEPYLRDVSRAFQNYKALAEAAIAQISDADLHRAIDPDSNSIAIIMKHMTGNLRSRFTDFLTTDGEKPERNRDGEFEMALPISRMAMLEQWNDAWATTTTTLAALAPADLGRTVQIRGETFLVVEALNRAVTHVSYHVGEIVLLAKHFAGPGWRSLSIPKGKSAEYLKGAYKGGMIPPSKS